MTTDTVRAAAATVADTLGDRLDATLRRDGTTVVAVLPDRRLRVEPREGPDGDRRWTLAVVVDGDTVGKHGPFASAAAVADRATELAEEGVGYTVCCDGRRS